MRDRQTSPLPLPLGEGWGEGAAHEGVQHEQTIARNVAEILET